MIVLGGALGNLRVLARSRVELIDAHDRESKLTVIAAMAAVAGSVSMSNASQRAVEARTGTAASQDPANSARFRTRRLET